MSNLPKKQIKLLKSNENISDVIVVANGNTLIRANTGTGKTWFIINILMRKYHVVFVCPNIGQVKQCEETYGNRDDIAFIYGDKRIPAKSIKKLIKQNLVMTYDQFRKYEPELGKDTILVVDECQKLIGAAILRDHAIQPIINSLKSQKFDRCIFLTATLTEHLFGMLGIHISQYYDIQKKDEMSRNIQLVRYQTPHVLNWYGGVLQRLKDNREKGQDKLMLIRINDIDFSKQVKLMFEKEGFNVMLVNRQEMANPKCHEMLSLEKLDCSFQVVICTSILDEAINLNNADDEVDSIHIVGQPAHPEEVTQFIGRLRKARPPVYIHLPAHVDMKKIDAKKMDESWAQKMQSDFHKLTDFLQNDIRRYVNKDRFKDFGDLVSTKMDEIKMLNALTNELVECKGFRVENNEISLNTASILGRVYQVDLKKCYQNAHYLKYRLQQLMPHAEVYISSSNSTVSDDLIKELKLSAEEIKLTKKKIIPEVAQKVVEMLQPSPLKLAQLFSESRDEGSNLYQKAEQPIHYEVFQEMAALGSRLPNLVDIVDTIEKERTNKVMKLGYQYQSHPVVNIIMTELSKRIKKGDFKSKLHCYEDITGLMNKWIAKLSQSRSIIALLKEYPSSYISVDDQGKASFVDGGSINFLKYYCHVKVLNDKKGYTAKKVRFLDLCAFGYSFCDVPASIQKKYITIDGKEYDASSGRSRKIEDKLTRSFEVLFEDDEA